jgi:hypothetical protein
MPCLAVRAALPGQRSGNFHKNGVMGRLNVAHYSVESALSDQRIRITINIVRMAGACEYVLP